MSCRNKTSLICDRIHPRPAAYGNWTHNGLEVGSAPSWIDVSPGSGTSGLAAAGLRGTSTNSISESENGDESAVPRPKTILLG